MSFPPPKHRFDPAEQTVLRDLAAQRGLSWKDLAQKVGGGSHEGAERYGVKMLNGNDECSRPAWGRVLELLSISTADFLELVSRQRSVDSRLALNRLNDPIAAARVVFFGNYLKLIASLSDEPGASVTAVDTTGGATQFTNWVMGNPLYEGLLQMNAVWVRAFRGCNGPSGIAMRRVFIVDPLALTAEGLSNIEATLLRHLSIGIIPGVIYKTGKTPNGVVADIGNLSDKVCIDAGIVEGLNGQPPKLRDVMTKRGHKGFNDIRDRVAWASEKGNMDVDVYCAAVIPDLLAELKKRIKRA